MAFNPDIKIIRERIFIKPNPPKNQEVIDEITILNLTNEPLANIHLPKSDFMIGLKVYDESGAELVVYPNRFTRQYLEQGAGTANKSKNIEDILSQMKSREVYVIWIKLTNAQKIKPYESKVIRLKYHNIIKEKKFNISLSKLKFLFSIPRFRINYKTVENDHDIFYILRAPEGYEINYAINKLSKTEKGKEIDLSDSKEVDYNGNERIISIRTPISEEGSEFDMIYDLIPELNERIFYSIIFFIMLGLSIGLLFISIKFPIDYSIYQDFEPLKIVIDNISRIILGLITINVSIMSLLRHAFTQRTRLWFFSPISIHVFSLLLR